jgi:hypothetical protein
MHRQKIVLALIMVCFLGAAGCSREQSDWEKAHTDNTADSYEAFVKKYPSGSFTAQAQARLKEIYEERDWQKARDTDTQEAYQAFLKQYPEGKWTEEARIRVENFSLAQAPGGTPAPTPDGSANGPAGPDGSPAAAAASAPGGSGVDGTAPGAAVTAAAGAAAVAAGAASHGSASAPTARAAQAGSGAAAKSAGKSSGKASGGTVVQLGAFSAGSAAAAHHWAILKHKYPSTFKGLTPSIHASKTAAGHSVFRLQVTGLAEATAHAMCKKLAAHKEACIVLPKAHHE